MIFPRRVALVALMFALLAMQTLGFMHRVVHSPQGSVAHLAQAHDAHEEHHALDIGHLFAGHEDDSACRVYDQLSHADLLSCVPAVALPVVPPAFLILLSHGDFVARWAALFDARGPPSVP
jgi:hypothetical protein